MHLTIFTISLIPLVAAAALVTRGGDSYRKDKSSNNHGSDTHSHQGVVQSNTNTDHAQGQGLSKDQIMCIIRAKLTPGPCKETALERAENGHDPNTACPTLEAFKSSMPTINCTEADYDILHSVVCEHKEVHCDSTYTTGSANRPNRSTVNNEVHSEAPTKEMMMCIISEHLTAGQCRDTAMERAENGHDPTTACSTLEAFKSSMSTVGCTEKDFEILRRAVCEHEEIPCNQTYPPGQ